MKGFFCLNYIFMKWISVKDQLPDKPKENEEPKTVLISGIDDEGNKYVWFCQAFSMSSITKDIFGSAPSHLLPVTHWQPLPEPPNN